VKRLRVMVGIMREVAHALRWQQMQVPGYAHGPVERVSYRQMLRQIQEAAEHGRRHIDGGDPAGADGCLVTIEMLARDALERGSLT
jgi:hypothetical protein